MVKIYILALLLTIFYADKASAYNQTIDQKAHPIKLNVRSVDSLENLNKLPPTHPLIIPIFYQKLNLASYELAQELTNKLKEKLPNSKIELIDLSVISRRKLDEHFLNYNHCAIATDSFTTQKILTTRKPIQYYSLLTPRVSLEKLHRIYNKLNINVSGIYNEQPLSRQLYLAKAIENDLTETGIILGQQDKAFYKDYTTAAKRLNLKLHYNILRNVIDAPESFLKYVAKDDGYFILTNNPQIYTPSRLASLIMSAYYKNIKVIGSQFSDAKAGALASVYTPIETLAIEATNEITQLCKNLKNYSPRYARSFSVVINQQIAKNFNMENLDADQLSQQIAKKESVR